MKKTVGALAIAGAVFCFANTALAETVLKFSHSYTADDDRQKLAEFIAEELAKRTGGEIKLEIYPNQQLFKARQQYDGLKSNQIDFAIYPMPWLSGKVPLANVGVLPGLVDGKTGSTAWRGTPAWKMLEDAVEKSGVHMAGIFWDPAGLAAKGKAPMQPSDLKGLKVRGMGKPLEVMLADYGATIVSMPAADTYLATQTGTIDALFSTLSSFRGYRMYEVVDTLVDTGDFLAGGLFILASPRVKALGGKNAKILEEVLVAAERMAAQQAGAEAQRTYDAFRAKGVKVVPFTAEQRAAWDKAARDKAWSSFASGTPGGKELLDAIAAAQAGKKG